MSRSPHIQLEVDFRRHPRMFRLGELLDVPWQVARVLVEDLWFLAREHGPDVTAMSPLKIADDLSWRGDPDELIDALHKAEWLVTHRDRRMIAHWEVRYRKLEALREKAKLRKRRQRARDVTPNQGRDSSVTEADITPEETKNSRNQEGETELNDVPLGFSLEGEPSPPPPNPVDLVVETYRQERAEYFRRKKRHVRSFGIDAKHRRLIRDRLRDYDVTDLQNAVRGMFVTPHNLGENDKGEEYLGLDIPFRSSGQVDRFISNFENPPKPRPVSGESRAERQQREAHEWAMEASDGPVMALPPGSGS